MQVANLFLLQQIWAKSEICQFKNIDHVIPMQPEVTFLTNTVDNLKLFGQELTELWIYESNDKERI